jgi:hypothetical protein
VGCSVQTEPFHTSASGCSCAVTVFLAKPPTASHDTGEVQETDVRPANAWGGCGLGAIDQDVPFHASMSPSSLIVVFVDTIAWPTATQEFEAGHDTLVR